MADEKQKTHIPSDEELLAKAIPIEEVEAAADDAPKPGAADVPEVLELDEAEPTPHREIRSFDTHRAVEIEKKWKRQPFTNNTGAIHVRTFVAKLRLDAIEHMDEQINRWLDEHGYEVKFATATVGILTGKLREEALFINVWV